VIDTTKLFSMMPLPKWLLPAPGLLTSIIMHFGFFSDDLQSSEQWTECHASLQNIPACST